VPAYDSLAHPVRSIPGDPDTDSPDDCIALCLSGGGFRAMLFHTGAMWRLNELGYLPKLARISSVSGGSIAAGVLALAWKDLEFDEATGVAQKFEELVAEKLIDLTSHTLDVESVLVGLALPGQSISERVAHAYRKMLYGRASLQDLPPDPAPMFVFNATSLQTGVLFRFSRTYMADYLVGRVDNPDFPLAEAVAASSAFPPVLSPSEHDVSSYEFVAGSGQDPKLSQAPYTTRLVLSDGGVYDNLGLETAWKKCKTILVSDGGGQMPPMPEPPSDWARLSVRVLKTIDNQVRSLRKQQAIEGYKSGLRTGTYWGIRSHMADYPAPSELEFDQDATEALANYPTRLAEIDPPMRNRLINWGYAICDAAMRSHVTDSGASAPAAKFPRDGGVIGAT
jgi:NTE family protein